MRYAIERTFLLGFILGFWVVVAIGCGEINDALNDSDSDNDDNTIIVEPTHIIPDSGNPIAEGLEDFRDGNEGNLWKPVSDNTGYLVVLLHAKYKQLFNTCQVVQKNGNSYPMFLLPGFNFTNSNRQTWRTKLKCNQLNRVEVVCFEPKQSITFTVDKKIQNKVCERHD